MASERMDSDSDGGGGGDGVSALVKQIRACPDLMRLIARAKDDAAVLGMLTSAIRTVWRTQGDAGADASGKRKRGEGSDSESAQGHDRDDDEEDSEDSACTESADADARAEPNAAVAAHDSDAAAAAAPAAPAARPPRRKREPETTCPLALVLLPIDADATAAAEDTACRVCDERVKNKSGGLTLDGRAVHAKCILDGDTPLATELPLSLPRKCEEGDVCAHCAKAIAAGASCHATKSSDQRVHAACAMAYTRAVIAASDTCAGVVVVAAKPNDIVFQGEEDSKFKNGAVLTGAVPNAIAWWVMYIRSLPDATADAMLDAAAADAAAVSVGQAALGALRDASSLGLEALLKLVQQNSTERMWLFVAICRVVRRMCAAKMEQRRKSCPVRRHAYACGVKHSPPAKRSRGGQRCKCWRKIGTDAERAALDACPWMQKKQAVLEVAALCELVPRFAAAFSWFGAIASRSALIDNVGRLLRAAEALRAPESLVCCDPDIVRALGGSVHAPVAVAAPAPAPELEGEVAAEEDVVGADDHDSRSDTAAPPPAKQSWLAAASDIDEQGKSEGAQGQCRGDASCAAAARVVCTAPMRCC